MNLFRGYPLFQEIRLPPHRDLSDRERLTIYQKDSLLEGERELILNLNLLVIIRSFFPKQIPKVKYRFRVLWGIRFIWVSDLKVAIVINTWDTIGIVIAVTEVEERIWVIGFISIVYVRDIEVAILEEWVAGVVGTSWKFIIIIVVFIILIVCIIGISISGIIFIICL